MVGMICLFQGKRGCGKTLSMSFWGTQFQKIGWRLMSNYSLDGVEKFDESFLFNLNKHSDIRDCVLLVDEMQLFFDSRLWKASASITFSHFVQQLRKRNIVILGTTQYLDTLEKRIRQHIDVLIKPSFDEDTQICCNTVFDITSLESSSDPDWFEIAFFAPDIYKKYNTNEIL